MNFELNHKIEKFLMECFFKNENLQTDEDKAAMIGALIGFWTEGFHTIVEAHIESEMQFLKEGHTPSNMAQKELRLQEAWNQFKLAL